MSFDIHPLTPDDFLETFAVADEAFSAFNKLLFDTYPPSSESMAKLTEIRLKLIGNMTGGRLFKAVDRTTGRIVGAARWIISEQDEALDESIEEVVDGFLQLYIPEMNREVTRAFYTMAQGGKREILGVEEGGKIVKLRRRVELETVFTHPDYQRRGVGTALIYWGIEEADRLGLELYLEATQEGRPLYDRLGFSPVKTVDFDASEYGGNGVHRYTFMLREPRAQSVANLATSSGSKE